MTDFRFQSYEEWCRTQFEMAHHDIWWIKGQQMQAGNWTLLLLGAIVGVSQLLRGTAPALPDDQGRALGIFAVSTVALGSYYIWDLYLGMVRARERANMIVRFLQDDANKIFKPTKDNPKRHVGFPLVLVGVLSVALGIALYLIGVRDTDYWFWPLMVLVGADAIGYSEWADLDVTTDESETNSGTRT